MSTILSLVKSAARLDDALETFLQTLKPNSRRSYQRILIDWREFLRTHGLDMLTATQLEAERWLQYQARKPGQESRFEPGVEQKVEAATLARKAVIMYSIYKNLIIYEAATHNPFTQVKVKYRAPSGEKRPTEGIPFDRLPALIAAPGLGIPEGVRDTALLSVLYGGALRRSEAVGIDLQHVRISKTNEMYLVLPKTKSGKLQQQVLPEWARANVERLLAQRRREGATDRHPLFVMYFGETERVATTSRMSTSTAYRIVKRYCAAVGLSKNFTPHSLRATAVTKLLSDGVDYRAVQEFSRHASTRMVEVYDKRTYSIENHPGKKLKLE